MRCRLMALNGIATRFVDGLVTLAKRTPTERAVNVRFCRMPEAELLGLSHVNVHYPQLPTFSAMPVGAAI